MYIGTIFLFVTVFIILTVHLPYLIMQCSCCYKHKLRFFFKIHKTYGILPFNSRNISLCRKCCKKYGFDSINDFKIYQEVRYKVENKIGEFSEKYEKIKVNKYRY